MCDNRVIWRATGGQALLWRRHQCARPTQRADNSREQAMAGAQAWAVQLQGCQRGDSRQCRQMTKGRSRKILYAQITQRSAGGRMAHAAWASHIGK